MNRVGLLLRGSCCAVGPACLPIGGVKGATEGALARHPPRGELALLNTVPPLLAAPRAALTLELGERRGHRA